MSLIISITTVNNETYYYNPIKETDNYNFINVPDIEEESDDYEDYEEYYEDEDYDDYMKGIKTNYCYCCYN